MTIFCLYSKCRVSINRHRNSDIYDQKCSVTPSFSDDIFGTYKTPDMNVFQENKFGNQWSDIILHITQLGGFNTILSLWKPAERDCSDFKQPAVLQDFVEHADVFTNLFRYLQTQRPSTKTPWNMPSLTPAADQVVHTFTNALLQTHKCPLPQSEIGTLDLSSMHRIFKSLITLKASAANFQEHKTTLCPSTSEHGMPSSIRDTLFPCKMDLTIFGRSVEQDFIAFVDLCMHSKYIRAREVAVSILNSLVTIVVNKMIHPHGFYVTLNGLNLNHLILSTKFITPQVYSFCFVILKAKTMIQCFKQLYDLDDFNYVMSFEINSHLHFGQGKRRYLFCTNFKMVGPKGDYSLY